MVLTFEYGFTYKGFRYGWHRKELYRLPSRSGPNTYCLKKLALIRIGNQHGYRLKGTRLTLEQLEAITVAIEPVAVTRISHKDCPF